MNDQYRYDQGVSYSSETGRVGFHVRDSSGRVVATSDHPLTAQQEAEMRNYNNGYGQNARPSGR